MNNLAKFFSGISLVLLVLIAVILYKYSSNTNAVALSEQDQKCKKAGIDYDNQNPHQTSPFFNTIRYLIPPEYYYNPRLHTCLQHFSADYSNIDIRGDRDEFSWKVDTVVIDLYKNRILLECPSTHDSDTIRFNEHGIGSDVSPNTGDQKVVLSGSSEIDKVKKCNKFVVSLMDI